jgi:group II intron reverse transcriptase/maturase
MTVDELPQHLKENWRLVRAQLLDGTYQPQRVLRRSIPKEDGGVRELGIPTVLDRFIQQAILQVLGPRFDPTFSQHNYGYRPGRSAHDAVREAHRHVWKGLHWVVDVDLEQFFDRVNHDVLMRKLSERIEDKRMLRLIRRYLEAGVLAQGVVTKRHEGTPQGGPLSPLLANVLLDEVDKELERRGHAFVRYADDCNVYVRSKRAGERVMNLLRRLYGHLRLRINEAKSAVAKPQDRKFLGFTFNVFDNGWVFRWVAPKAIEKLKQRVRSLTRRNCGRSIETRVAELRRYLSGWKAYFHLAQMPRTLCQLDEWIRHKLRVLRLKQWKTGTKVFAELTRRGVPKPEAARAASWRRHFWKTAAWVTLRKALAREFDDMGLPRLAA